MKNTIADRIVERAAPSAEPQWLADVLQRLVWIMDENGAEVMGAVERCLQGNDERKLRVALAIDDVFPFQSEERMAEVLRRVAEKWPEHRARCDQLIESRRDATNQSGLSTRR